MKKRVMPSIMVGPRKMMKSVRKTIERPSEWDTNAVRRFMQHVAKYPINGTLMETAIQSATTETNLYSGNVFISYESRSGGDL